MKKKYVILALLLISPLFLFIKPSKKPKDSPISFAVVEEKPFVVIIHSHNNAEICERNLRSVFEQKYQNYRVIYIEDAYTDETYQKVAQLIEEKHVGDKVSLIKNSVNQGAMANLYRAIHGCNDKEIIVCLDGNDWLAHDWVLKRLNEYYANPDIWMTYGGYLNYPKYSRGRCSKKIPSRIYKRKGFREYMKKKGVVASHLKTFYASIANTIPLQDCLYQGEFFPEACDAALVLPLLEKCGAEHIYFTKDPLYIYNRTNYMTDQQVLPNEIRQACWQDILSRKPHASLSALPQPDALKPESRTDLIAFSFDRPMQLYSFLESFYMHVRGSNGIYVIYRCSDQHFQAAYEEVKKAFPKVIFQQQSEQPHIDFKPLLLKFLKESSAEFLLFAVDDIVVSQDIDLKECIEAMEHTKAYGFYFRLGLNVDYCYALNVSQGIPKHVSLKPGIFAWQFSQGVADWKYPNTVDMTVYRKSDILNDLENMSYRHPNSLESEWAKRADNKKVGLCYSNSKIVNIPLSIVNISSNRNMNSYSSKELLHQFEAGLKIDIKPVTELETHSAHIEYNPQFITR